MKIGLSVEEESREGTQQKRRGHWRNGGKELEEAERASEGRVDVDEVYEYTQRAID